MRSSIHRGNNSIWRRLVPKLKQQKKATSAASIQWEAYPLLNIPHIRQSTDYSCGSAALMAVLQYYRLFDGSESVLCELLNTTEDWGTEPENIVEIAIVMVVLVTVPFFLWLTD